MPSTLSLNSTALLILEQVRPSPASAVKQRPAADQLVAAANGVPIGGAGKPSRAAQAKIVEAMFSANTVDANKLKIKLMERLGKEFGFSPGDFETSAAFGAAVRDAVGQLKMQEGGHQIVAAIEKKLGLDKLGLTLDALVNALIDPESEDGLKLETALRKQAAEEAKASGKDAARALLTLMTQRDEAGLYGL
ncbi:hypothetical protein [Hyphomicrobium sp.]|uniref:hypothetical protein n=1 Tax=Hyphomicrobium sp. TaxID=82 RepID=UPI0025B8892A|nr:hypothetical protein [Hyphomicrobium sp.]MCC7252689.1 hypothetical protein [Hyphomicrobium sp.]